ncbi:hypothetical protein EJO69_06890 [Flaviflexus salsibiostraticola]|uniref:Uncharacterized protein n=1 Tax=Flaviflexus salsibiostraticola TaxID=1282737 RepID=A0A3S8Z969_9ACTO|nr:hypothetical protein [Flaviflexus salsibiostraticola]AZN30067.1 hypothetical protein EJO69_06890 [Flaviflexus salsibiostraticola]
MTMSARARALVSLVGAAVLFGAVSLGPVATAVAGVIIGLILATGWAFLIDLPNPGTARRVIVAVSVAANAVAYFFGVRELAFVAGFTVVVGFVAEMARRDGRPRLLEQISGTVAGSMLVVMGALWTRTLALDAGVTAARAVLTAVAVAIVLEILIPHSLRSLRHVVYMTGGFSGGLLFMLFSDIAWYAAPLAGLAAGSILAMFDSILRRLPPATRRRPGATLAMVPLCAAAVVAYTLALVIT